MENQVSTAPALANTSAPAAPSVNFFDPQQFEIAQRMSKMFACSKLVPTTYQISEIYTEKLKQQEKLPQDQQLAPKQVYEEAKLEAMSNCIIALDIAQRIGFNGHIYAIDVAISVYDLTEAIRAAGAAPTVFTVEDVADRFDGTDEEAAAWLIDNRRRLDDLLSERGNEAIESLLMYDGKLASDDEDEADEEEAAMRERGVTPEAFAASVADTTVFLFSYGDGNIAKIKDEAAELYASLDAIRAVPGFRRAIIVEAKSVKDAAGFREVVRVHPRHPLV